MNATVEGYADHTLHMYTRCDGSKMTPKNMVQPRFLFPSYLLQCDQINLRLFSYVAEFGFLTLIQIFMALSCISSLDGFSSNLHIPEGDNI